MFVKDVIFTESISYKLGGDIKEFIWNLIIWPEITVFENKDDAWTLNAV